MSSTQKNRKLAIAAITSAAFAAPALCGLVNQTSASTLTLDSQGNVPTIAAITTSTVSPYTTTGGFSSNYRNNTFTNAATYAPTNIFNGSTYNSSTKTITVGAGNSLSYSGGGQYAASGINPAVTTNGDPGAGTGTDGGDQNDIDPLIATKYSSSVSANVIVFAQRDASTGDQVSQVNLWFSSSPFTVGYSPASDSGYVAGTSATGLDAGTYTVNSSPLSSLGSPTESIAITDLSDTNLNEYIFPDYTTQSGQYVLMQFVDSSAPGFGTGNPGASAFALGTDTTVPEPASFSAGAIALAFIGLRRRRRA